MVANLSMSVSGWGWYDVGWCLAARLKPRHARVRSRQGHALVPRRGLTGQNRG